ncbi:MAG: ABC-F family ATP-binding cassette domain-containing protein [Fluviibacter sp.]
MITLKNLTLRRGARVLLDDASCVINPGERVGLVGRNGAGKSTLFALLNGTLHEDRGDFVIPAQWRMAQVAQDMPETNDSATRFVIEGDTRLVEAEAEVTAAEASGDGERMAYAYTHLNDVGAHDAQARAQALILGLGFKPSELDQAVNSFSGGWRMRLQLARALMCPSDLLLLDEPTNHLDLDALVWLEAWLKRYTGTLIVISHDREFLDAITNVTIHIDHGKLVRYGGNYSAFEDLRAEQLSIQQASFAKQQDKIAHLQSFINRFKAKASKAKQAQSRVKALERMEKIAPVLADAEFSFAFEEPGSLPNPMLAMEDAAFGYPPPAGAAPGTPPTIIVQHANRSVLAGQRIGILGANGQGKSTVVKTIAKDLKVQGGTVTEGRGLTIGYFAQQELDVLSADSSPLEHMIRLAKDALANGVTGRDTRQQSLRTYLGTFNFSGDQVMQAVGTMSGGEKARLVLAMIVWQRPNLLLLDEPTNHLDLATREALSVALNEFEGTVMLVSHDRALLRAVCDSFWLVANGRVTDFDGDLDDYQQYLLDEARRQRDLANATSTTKAPVAVTPAPKAKPASRQLKALQRDLEKVDLKIPELQAEKSTLEHALAATSDPATLTETGSKLHSIQNELDELERRWLELSEEIDACQR